MLMSRSILVNKRALLQYIYIYISIQYIGGRVAEALGADWFGILCLSLSGVFILRHFRSFISSPISTLCVILLILMTVTVFLTSGGLSYGTVFSLLSRFMIVTVSIEIDREQFINRFLKMSYLMACTSLLLFFMVQILGNDTMYTLLFSHLFEIKSSNQWMPSSYGLFWICYNYMNAARNSYMFGEPGEYQMLINLALFFTIFARHEIRGREKRRYLIVFIATLVTIQSTTGFFNIIILALALLCSRSQYVTKRMKRVIVLVTLGVIVYVSFFLSENSMIYTQVIRKITDASTGGLNLAAETGADRVTSILDLIRIAKEQPLSLLFGVGYSGIVQLRGGFSCSGIVNTIIMLGVFTCLVLYSTIIRSIVRFSPNKYAAFFIVFMIINNGLSQPDLLAITAVIVCCYNLILKEEGYKESVEIEEAI